MIKNNVYVTMPTLAPLSEVQQLLEQVWSSGIMTHNGPLVQRFEREVACYLGSPQMVACTNGTLALQVAVKALGLRGEIITTPFTFVATISSIMWERCSPVFVDIDPDTFNIDPAKIEEKITDRTVAIMPVHVFGNSCDIDAIDAIAKKHSLKVIYDACHSFGVRYKGKSVFSFGDISVTSFHATKMLNTAEGGGCFTKDPELDAKMRRIRFFGFENHADIVEEGFNGKMTEVNAAVGIANLRYMDAALADRKAKYLLYKSVLEQKDCLSFQKISEDSCNYCYFPVVFPNEATTMRVIEHLQASHVFPRRYFYPSVNTFKHILPYEPMPNSEDLASRILCLPLYYSLPTSAVNEIAELITDVL